MENEAILEKYGLFRAKVPRFTSYPPANKFELDAGHRYQAEWLGKVKADQPVSLYVHIPFCRRICYFCACRTQGTKTLKPVASYVSTLLDEVRSVRNRLPKGVKMARLHFGGGTPTLLSTELMNRLCDAIYTQFQTSDDFEFSVEIDPTEAADGVLETLADWRLGRASIGIQDFMPEVQMAIGREQSFAQTRDVIEKLRSLGIESTNFDLVYGLPHQTRSSLADTLVQVLSLSPDRLALYGYAHVPQMSKRQVMISENDLADAHERFHLATLARNILTSHGLVSIGIDHFATEADSLARAARDGHLRRNFQGYTDDPCRTLIGFGASAISEFPQGYAQNAVATAAYVERIERDGLAGHRGYAMRTKDKMVADLVQDLMCDGAFDVARLKAAHPLMIAQIDNILSRLVLSYPDALDLKDGRLSIREDAASLTRVIASTATSEEKPTGSLAI
ncbi:MAG: oxygen-independent coproporphyrinogen III oxidase [Pseudomonadota bacterium]